MISSALLAIIRCPHTNESLRVATGNEVKELHFELKNQRLFNQLGIQLEESIAEGLMNESLSYFIMIRDGVPDLSPDNSIPVDHLEFSTPNEEPSRNE